MSYFVGICGGSGSGKTYFLNQLLGAFKEGEVCLLSMDNYYKPQDQQESDENGVVNYDLPSALDSQAFIDDLLKLKRGEVVVKEEYTFNNPNRKPEMLTFSPAPVIVIEGLFIYHFPQIVELLDLKLFVETDEIVKVKRRILRDSVERGYDLHDVLYRYEFHVLPAYEKFVRPYVKEVDLLIANNKGVERALDVIVTFLKSKLV